MRNDLKVTGAAALAAIGLAWVLRPKQKQGKCKVKLAGMFTRGVDDYAPFAAVAACDNAAKPGAIAFRSWILEGVGGTDLGIGRNCDTGAPSKHHEGRAWDWAPPDEAAGNALTACLTSPDEDGEPDAVARRAGLRTIIWHRRIWVAGRGWKPYDKPGGSPHTDHVHFGFGWPGANGQTSLYEVLETGGMVPTAEVELTIGGGDTVEVRELLGVPGLADNSSAAFKRRAIELADAMGIDPSLWLAVMSFESAATFDPAQKNFAGSGAVGLIQFTRKYAPIVVGKTVDQLAAMTAIEQLDYVDKWYRYNNAFKRIEHERDYYLTVFSPSGVGKALTHALYVSPSEEYNLNAAMDLDGDGVITVGDVSGKFRAFVKAAELAPVVLVPMRGGAQEGAAIVVALALAVAATAAIVENA